jgi:tRNA-Thr(GGU) m(6)t(6)A37 methyltransferase TsaA
MPENIILKPIAFVKNERKDKSDDNWGNVISEIELVNSLPVECFDGISDFSHLEIIFYFNKSNKVVIGSEHPRENKNWPKVGIFAQRKKDRPNHLGLTIVKLIKVEKRILIVSGLDAIDGTPILDIKPVFTEFLPDEDIKQAAWTKKLMNNYWDC